MGDPSAIVLDPMDAKPDPKPGRWILPLIIVAMVGFTYVFVSSIDGSADGGNGGADGGVDLDGTTTTLEVIDTSVPGDGGEGGETDPETDAYIEQLQGFDADLQRISGDLVAANDAWDADEAGYTPTVDAFEAAVAELETWSGSVTASTPPAGRPDLAEPHQAVVDAAAAPLTAAQEALTWLESSDEGSADNRRQAIADLEAATQAFSDAVTAAVTTAGG
jgi:hypothetical protein